MRLNCAPIVNKHMWCDKVLGNLSDAQIAEASDDKRIDFIDLRWTQCRRSLDAVSRSGRRFRVLLAPDSRIAHGDILYLDERESVVVNVVPEEMIVVSSADANRMALLALELGNLHWPTQIDAGQIIFPEDGPAMATLEKLGLAFTREKRRFRPAATIVMTTVGISTDFNIRAIKTTNSAAPAPASPPACK